MPNRFEQFRRHTVSNVVMPENIGSGRARRIVDRAGRVAAVSAGAAIALGGISSDAKEVASFDGTSHNDKQTTIIVEAPNQGSNPLQIDFGKHPEGIAFKAIAQQTPLVETPTQTPVLISDVREHKVVKGDIVSKIANDELNAAGFAKPTGAQEKVQEAFIGAVNDIKNLNKIHAGDTLAVPDETITYQIAEATHGTGEQDIVAAVDKVIHAPTLNAARDQAYDLAKILRFSKTSLNIQKPTVAAKPFGIELLKPKLNDTELAQDIQEAKTNGWVKDAALQDTYATIWGEQKAEGKQSNAATNLTSRLAVQLSTYDTELNSTGTFDEHKMRHGDESSNFVEATDAVRPLLRGIAQLSDKQMETLQKEMPDDEFQMLATLWAVNHGSTGSKDAIITRDRAAMEVYLAVAKNVNLSGLPSELSTFLQEIEGKSDTDIAKAMVENQAALQQFFQEATGTPPVTQQPTPNNPPPTVGTEPDVSTKNWFQKNWGYIAGGLGVAGAALIGAWDRRRSKRKSKFDKGELINPELQQHIERIRLNPLTAQEEKIALVESRSNTAPNIFVTGSEDDALLVLAAFEDDKRVRNERVEALQKKVTDHIKVLTPENEIIIEFRHRKTDQENGYNAGVMETKLLSEVVTRVKRPDARPDSPAI